MQHGDIWRGLDRLAEKHGLTVSGLAKLAGLDATAFNKSKRVSKDGRYRWPSTESIARALQAVEADFGDFAALVTGQYGQTIPILDLEQASLVGMFDGAGQPILAEWEHVRFSRKIGHDWIFAIELTGNEGAPFYRSGDRIIVSAGAETRHGDRVLVKLSSGALMVARLGRQTANRVELSDLSDDAVSVFHDSGQIAWIARILWVSQ